MPQVGPLQLCWRRYRFALPQPLVTSQGAWRERSGWLLQLQGADGALGWGEAAALPGHEADLEGALRQLPGHLERPALERLLPRDDRYRHAHGSPGHGADHVLPGIVSPSVTVPVADGRPLLGTWQSVVLVDLNSDNPRRTVRLSFLAAR